MGWSRIALLGAVALLLLLVVGVNLGPGSEWAGAAGRGRAPVAGNTRHPATQASYYLALGDSVPVWDGTSSYPNLLLGRYAKTHRGLHLVNLAVSGETTTSMIRDGQYSEALAFLRSHRGQVALITIDIGGNDVVGCGFSGDLDSTCVQRAEATMTRHIATILGGLHKAASGAPVFGMTYFNPFLGDWLAGGVDRTLAVATTDAAVTLNNDLVSLYGPAYTADVQRAFDLTGSPRLIDSAWGPAPRDVVDACRWLDIQCTAGQPEGFGDDPNDAGQVQIARAFERVIDQSGLLRRHPPLSVTG